MSGTASEPGPRLPPAYRLVALDRVGSSNDEAKRLAEEGAEDGTLVWVREQDKGRGRQGRTWSSPPGNLYFSLVLRPDCTLAQASQLAFVAALAVGDGVGSVAPPMVEIHYKWPNDVLFNGRKGAGILLESKMAPEGGLEWLVLGVGVNVKSHPEDTEFPATSLCYESAEPGLSEVDLLQAISRHFLAWVDRWLAEGFAPIRQAWLRHGHGLGESLRVRLPGETLHGIFRDLGEGGALMLEMPDGAIRSIAAGDVYFDGPA